MHTVLPVVRPAARTLVLALLVVLLLAAASAPVRADGPAPGNAVLRGQVTLRDGTPAGAGTVDLVRMDVYERGYASAPVDADGRWEVSVAPGSWTVTARTAAGLPTSWPDLPGPWPEELRPRVTVAAGETRDAVDIRARSRSALGAIDEYGAWNPGTDDPAEQPPASDEGVARYPWDPVRPVGVVHGPRIEDLPGEGPRDAQGVRFAITGIRANHTVEIVNRGDDATEVRAVRVEGPDSDLLQCVNPGLMTDFPCTPQVLFPNWAYRVTLPVGQIAYRPVYRVTVVLELAHPDRTLRYPVEIRNLLPEGVQVADVPDWVGWLLPKLTADQGAALLTGTRTPKVLAAAARAAARGVVVERRRVGIAFPGAGTARVGIERRTTGRRPRWRAVRTVRLSAKRAATVARRVPALRPGRYRLRVRVALRGLAPRTATVVRTVRR